MDPAQFGSKHRYRSHQQDRVNIDHRAREGYEVIAHLHDGACLRFCDRDPALGPCCGIDLSGGIQVHQKNADTDD